MVGKKDLRDWVSRMIKSRSEDYFKATRLAHNKVNLDQVSNIEIRFKSFIRYTKAFLIIHWQYNS